MEGIRLKNWGTIKKLGKRAFIVTDTIMEKLGYLEKCIQQLNKKSITVSTYNKVDAEPTNIHVLEALSLCKEEKCDFIIGIGGGSCIDAAKAVAVLYTNGGEVEDYVEKDIEIENNPLPLIAIQQLLVLDRKLQV